MDRSKWEYKKLGEICSKLTDGSHNPPKGIENSDYRMISSQNIFNDKIVLNDYRYLSKEDFETEDKRTALKKGDLLLTIVGAIGRCYVLNGTEGNLTLQRSVAALTPKDTISSRFLMYYFIGNNANLLEEAHGAAQKGIYLRQLSNLIVPVPTLDDQQRIVAELDCLNEMIAVKQEQLKEFDKLAQSIFYDMFGDPVTNEKGWEVRNLGDLLNIPSRNGLSKPTAIRGKGVPMISMGEMFANPIITDNVKATLVPVTERELETSQIVSGDLLFARQSLSLEGAGKCSFVKSCSQPTVFESHLIRIRVNKNIVLGKYVFCYFQTPCGIAEVRKRVYQVAAAGIKGSELIKIPIPLPPLSLQQQFADKISAIEAQKELVKQSIAETQQLLDSRMDYYFD